MHQKQYFPTLSTIDLSVKSLCHKILLPPKQI